MRGSTLASDSSNSASASAHCAAGKVTLFSPQASQRCHVSTVAIASEKPEFAEVLSRPPRSLWRDAWRRLISNRLANVGMAIVVFFLLLAIAIPIAFAY